MASQGGNGNFDFNAGAGIDFTGFGMQPTAYNDLKGTGEGNTSPAFFFGDEGIDTTATFDHSFDSMFASVDPLSSTFGMEPLGLDNTAGNASWDVNSTFPMTPAQSFESLYTPQLMNKRQLQLDVGDYPPAKRHEAFSPFSTTSASFTAGSSNWALDTQPTPAATSESVGLSDEAADVCATWFSKYNVLPSDRHIDSLSQLTGESASAIRQWFGQALKQGMTGQDSAYKSQTSLAHDPILFPPITHATTSVTSQQLAITDSPCNHMATQALTTLTQSPLRGGKKGCNPTEDPELLKRDSNKIYQCTRKCGKRYGRKCDWKRNEEEGYPSKSWLCSLCIGDGVERVKPCFRKYHFSQHFRNIHPGLNSADYEETSIVHSDTSLPSHARKCGFCTHRFVSRQDRIDHIAEHFKNGKCMLDWNEDEDHNDSDDMNDDDDNDDRPDSGGYGNGKPFFPPKSDPRGSSSGPKNNGGDGGQQPPQNGFYQFQVSQFADGNSRDTSPGLEEQIQQSSNSKQLLRAIQGTDAATGSELPRIISENTEQSSAQCSEDGRHKEAARDDSQTVAGDVVSMSTDIVQLQTISPHVPSSEGDPMIFDRLKSFTPRASASFTRESQDLLGSLKLLGAGGFSTVDEVVHRETSLRFARKTLKNRERSALDELKNEVEVLQKLRHPHIIRFVGSVQKENKMSILLSPVAETTLATWLDMKLQDRPDGLSQTIVNMLGCLASSIRYLHEQRPVVKHMDIKPQNILVKEGEKFPHVILSDFGISSIGELTANDKAMPLTRQYCAPEVSEGISRELASDVWSLGCVFLEMLTVAFKEDNSLWHEFPKQFGGRKGKYYWQDVPALQGLLTQSLQQAATHVEADATRAVKEMLDLDPVQRPTAPMLTMIFAPAPCCLSWPNAKATYPGPSEELQTAKALLREGGVDDCVSLHVATTQDKQTGQLFSHAKRWLEECSHEHEACRHNIPKPQANKTLPTRLIDISPDGIPGMSVRIVNSADLDDRTSADYAAISYLWSDDELKLSSGGLESMQTELARQSLPVGIEVAIAKAQDIGFRYVWVDSLCVLQDSQEDKERECRATADTYRNATLTIVLDQFKSQSAGLDKIHSGDPNTAVKNPEQQRALLAATLPLDVYMTPGFAWDTRAWSLQERLLSRRFLHLGKEQMYWECNALKASETFPRGYEAWNHAFSSLLWEKVHTEPSTIGSIQNQHDRKYDTINNNGAALAESAGQTTKYNANKRGAPCASKEKGYGKMGTPHHKDNFDENVKDLHSVRDGGDVIGNSTTVAGQAIDSEQLKNTFQLCCGNANNRSVVPMHDWFADDDVNGTIHKGNHGRDFGEEKMS